jgi:hypothetical protein
MRIQPKLAVAYLENGEVARWFAANGWSYPVLGPTAKGVAAVQQFFEGMGLSKSPVVVLVESEMILRGPSDQPVQGQLTLRTEARKWIYARADSDSSWLRIVTPSVSGPQQAIIAVEADPAGLQADPVREASVRITANSNQTLQARVRYEVDPPARPHPQAGPGPFLAGAVTAMALRLILALPADLYARVLRGEAGSFRSWLEPATADPSFVRHFVLATSWLGLLAGGLWLWKRGTRKTDAIAGLLAGGVCGLAASATLACLMPAIDALPRWTWLQVARLMGWTTLAGPAWLWTPLWIVWNVALWGGLGGLLGLVLGSCGWKPAMPGVSRAKAEPG